MRLIPGSHNADLAAIRQNTEIENVLGAEMVAEIDESQAVDMVLRPGEVEVHHPNIVHGSNGNTSANRHCGLTIRYVPTSTRITGDDHPTPAPPCCAATRV